MFAVQRSASGGAVNARLKCGGKPSIEVQVRAHATMKGGAKARALALSPTREAEKYRPFSKSTKYLWWIHLPGSVASLGKGPTEAKAWQAAALRLEGAIPPSIGG